ncbi:MAG: radical SAM protein [Candidatus Cloacimonetes bacterium]|nr:radical SAM protein [Candidatus Cloacimonadota bacterium]
MSLKPAYFKPFIGHLQQMQWIALHLRYYLFLNAQVLKKGIPPSELLVLKYPFRMPDAAKPPLLSVDITDACDLECVYCNNPLFPNPRTMMNDEIVSCLLQQVEKSAINRIRIGGGEPTLHPKFASIMQELACRTKFLSIVTNCQWKNPEFGELLLRTGVDLIEISVDAGGAEMFEKSRKNASYTRLITNLAFLRKTRDSLKSKAIIKIRLMLRPSTRHLEKAETMFLCNYCDCVLPQWVTKHPESDYSDDVFMQRSVAENTTPVCTVPFRDLQLRPDGRIPLCPAKGCTIEQKKQLFIGDICRDPLIEVWQCAAMREIRTAHRTRKGDVLKSCLNCHYG